MPEFYVCKVQNGHLEIPEETRSKYQNCSIRGSEWRQILQNFSETWGPNGGGAITAVPPTVSTVAATDGNAEDAADERQSAIQEPTTAFSWGECFPDEPRSKEDLEAKYGPGSHKFSLTTNATGIIINDGNTPKLFVLGTGDAEIGVEEPALCFGAGTWLLDQKAQSFLDDPGSTKVKQVLNGWWLKLLL